jgi:type I restriction enzyme S subunit
MKRVLVADLIESDEAGFACSKTRLVESGLPHLRPFNIGSDGALDLSEVYQVDPAEAPKGRGQLLAGDILFNNTNSAELVGKSAVVTAPMTAGFSNHLTRVRVDRSRVDPFWLSFWLRKLKASGYFTANATQWVSQAAYRTSDLGKLPIDLPSLAQQRTAVDLLARAEGIVRLRRQAQKKAAELIPALFVDIFGDPATNPKGWPTSRLRDLVEFQSGGTPSKARDDYWQGDVPWVSPKDMKRMALYDAIDHISSLVLAETSLKLVPARSVLIVVRGMILAHTVPVAETRAPLTVNQDMKALIPKGEIGSTYLLWMLQVCHDRLLAQVTTAAHGTKKLDTARLEEMVIPVPPIVMQQAFEANVLRLEAIQQHQVNAMAKAEAAFSALLARAFSAEGAAAAIHEAEEVVS